MPIITIKHLDETVYTNPKRIIGVNFGLRGLRNSMVGDVATKVNAILGNYFKSKTITCYGWLVMPNRISFVATPKETLSMFTIVAELQKLIERQALPHGTMFFGDFFDHVLRKTEDPRAYTVELFEKVCAAGLAEDWHAYPHLGSTTYDVATLASPIAPDMATMPMPASVTI